MLGFRGLRLQALAIHALVTLVSVILAHRIRNVIWLAADIHFAQVNDYDPDGDSFADFHEFIAGPLSA